VEVSQFYNSYKENSESALKRQPLTSKSKGKQRATDAEIWATMGRELPVQFQGQDGVDMALRIIEESSTCAGSSTKLKDRLAEMEIKVRSIRSFILHPSTLHFPLCSWRVLTKSLGRHLSAPPRSRMNWIDVSRTSILPSPQQMSYPRYPTTLSHPDYLIYHMALTPIPLSLTRKTPYAHYRGSICNARLHKLGTPHDELRGRLSGPMNRQMSRGS